MATSSDATPTIPATHVAVEIGAASTEELQAIKNDIVKRLADRARSDASIRTGVRLSGHDSVYHSKT